MDDLLQAAVQAHGGLKRWNQVQAIKVAASITGAIWFVKSKGDHRCQQHRARPCKNRKDGAPSPSIGDGK